MVSKRYTTQNSKETRALGTKFAISLKGGEVVCLYGNLGAGKTTFTQGLALGLGIPKNITSPTFILIREYQVNKTLTRNSSTRNSLTHQHITLYHLDCYRLENSTDALSLGLSDLFNNPNNIIVIEWAERIKELLPERRIDIYFENVGDDERKIKIIQN